MTFVRDLPESWVGVEEVVASAFTLFICDSESKSGNHINSLSRVFVGLASTDALGPDGAPSPARGTSLPAGASFPNGEQVRRALGLSLDDLDDMLKTTRRAAGVQARLEDATLKAFIPAALWDVAAATVVDGPVLSRTRIENFLDDYSRRMLPADRSKPAGHPTHGAIMNLVMAYKRFTKRLGALNSNGYAHPALGQWTLAQCEQPIAIPVARKSVRKGGAVPGHVARFAHQHLCEDIGRRLGVTPGDFAAEQQAILNMTPKQVRKAGLGRPMERRQVLMVLCVLGVRAGAAVRILEGDLVDAYQLSDGTLSPAIEIYEGKGTHRSLSVVRPIPADFLVALRSQTTFMRRWMHETGKAVPAAPPLIYASDGPVLSERALSQLMGGSAACETRTGQVATLLREGADPNDGYSAHTCRARARQWVASAEGERWLAEHGASVSAEWIAEALLGHDTNNIQKLYGGATKEREVELLVQFATRLTWEMLTTDLGARRRLPLELYRETLREIRRLETERQRAVNQIALLDGERLTLGARMETTGPQVTADSFRNVFAAYKRVDEQRIEQTRDRERLDAELVRLRALQHHRRTAFEARLIVPDGVPNGELEPIDPSAFDRIDEEEQSADPVTALTTLPRVRDYISTTELAGLVGMSRDTLSGYLRKGFPARGRRAPLWDPGVDPLTPDSTPKRQAVRVAALNMAHPVLATEAAQEALARLLATDRPAGW
ncbi:unannotated protein [freshwater metagenome]|uniref:Unannotated protein n=1 Tax=freshwater metagenome TaxID=449393 RepID=A0A6J7HLJ6_9ZZZZ|nr:hypothetical protein [Actinomycetota bacterium]